MTASKNRTIAIVTTSYPLLKDGSEAAGAFVAEFAKELTKLNIDVTVVAPSLAEQSCINEAGVNIIQYKVPTLPLSSLRATNPLDWFKIMKSLAAGRRALEKVFRNTAIDHVFAFWALPSGYWADKVCRQYAKNYSVWALGSDIWSLSKIPIVKHMLKRVLASAQHVYADGVELCGQVENISNRECEFLPSSRKLGRGLEHSPKKDPPYKLAFLGRWHKNKGPDIFLDALSQLPKSEWKLISSVRIAGGGKMYSVVTSKVNELCAKGKPVELLGFLDKEEAEKLIRWADYLVVPSRVESIPVIFSDAIQCSTPIICTPVGDLPYFLDKYQCGFLAEAVTSSALKEAIKEALKSSPSHFNSGFSELKEVFSLEQSVNTFIEKTFE